MKQPFLLNTYAIVSVCLAMFSCGRTGGEGGSETSFLKCATKSDCEDGYACVENECRKPARRTEVRNEQDAAVDEDAGPSDSVLKPDSEKTPDATDVTDLPDAGPILPPLRAACQDSTDCPSGSLCHLDDKCLAWGEKDEQGAELLATAPYTEAFYGIPSISVTAEGVYWLEWGTLDGMGNHNRDSAVRFLRHGDSESSLIHSGLSDSRKMVADSGQLFVTEDDYSRLVEITPGPQTAVRTLDPGCGGCLSSFVPNSDGFYYTVYDRITAKEAVLFQSRVWETAPVVFAEFDRSMTLFPGQDSYYLLSNYPHVSGPIGFAMNKKTGELSELPLLGVQWGSIFDFGGNVYFSYNSGVPQLGKLGTQSVLYSWDNEQAGNVFAVSEAGILADGGNGLIVIPTSPGTPRVLFTLDDRKYVDSAQIHGDHVYFTVKGRLMRVAL
ncbi:MAG: hypothetical protein RJA70_3126 [Pseudomonadota bacterium]|jgi:hypothetical protein